jgi:AraC family transcriptional activator of pobA
VLDESVALLEMSVWGAITGEMVSKQLRTLLFRIVRQLGNNTGPELSGYALVARFQALLKRDLCKKKSASAYARELGVSPNHMNQVVKRITGMSASYHIVQYKIAEAKKQSVLHQWDSKTMADYLGFKRISDFCRFFKTNAGIDFSDFRRNIYL